MVSFGKRFLKVNMSRFNLNNIFYLFLLLLCSSNVYGQNVSSQYEDYFVKFEDNRSMMEKVLNAAGVSNKDVGRSFALICGVNYYPNMDILKQNLDPAKEDVFIMQRYLKEYEYFDEIVVLENSNVTIDNLEYFLSTYFPDRLKKFPKSRFLFAYSGHGMTRNRDGYLLKNTARNLTDKNNSINLRILKVYMDEVVSAGHHVLVLLNSCYSGAFLKRSSFGKKPPIPKNPGAHAITAGGAGELSWADAQLGSGSIFFEKLIAGLGGIADDNTNGVITTYELASYLRGEIQGFTDDLQNPHLGDISKNGSQGEFFFLNRARQISENNLPEFKSDYRTSMGVDAEIMFDQGMEKLESKDFSSALSLFQRSSDLGNSKAMSNLGYMYFNGYGVKIDYKKAVKWYSKGAEEGNAMAMYNLGNKYKTGLGVIKNYYEAIKWYCKSAEAGNALAMQKLGHMYSNGDGVPIDNNEAVKWYRKGAEAGNSEAMTNLGYMYDNGYGVTKDYDEAVKWYRKGAEAGEATAMYNLAITYKNGSGEITKDNNEAMKWYQKSAEAGNTDAMYSLGKIYYYGEIVPRDIHAAFKWFSKAAKAGDADAMINLGFMYENGYSVAKDYDKATEWYQKAVEAGEHRANDELKRLGEELRKEKPIYKFKEQH